MHWGHKCMLTIMRDSGINKGLVQEFQTSDRRTKGAFYGFRKMFWTYLKKLHVGFYDPCCEAASEDEFITGTRFNYDTGVLEYYDPYTKSWIAVDDWAATTTTTSTTTTTTAATTTTTTTAAPTTTTTTSTTTTTTAP